MAELNLERQTRSRNRNVDYSGLKIGRLYVIERSDIRNKDNRRLWKCICDCQKDIPEDQKKYTYLTTGNIHNHKTKSCG